MIAFKFCVIISSWLASKKCEKIPGSFGLFFKINTKKQSLFKWEMHVQGLTCLHTKKNTAIEIYLTDKSISCRANSIFVFKVSRPPPPSPAKAKAKVTPARPATPTQHRRNTRLRKVKKNTSIKYVKSLWALSSLNDHRVLLNVFKGLMSGLKQNIPSTSSKCRQIAKKHALLIWCQTACFVLEHFASLNVR